MNKEQLITKEIKASIDTKQKILETLIQPIIEAGNLINQCLDRGNKILCCGNGGSSCDAQHFAGELVGRYLGERKSLPALALADSSATVTAIANDYGYDQVFARQVEGLGNAGDVLILITTSGNSDNLFPALEVARTKGLSVIALNGKSGGKLAQILCDDDIHLCIPSMQTAKVQESHIMLLHLWCEMIDEHLAQKLHKNQPETSQTVQQ